MCRVNTSGEEELQFKRICAVSVAVATMGLVTLGLSSVATAHDVAAEIDKVRQATMRFNDVNVALAEGYILAPPGDCVDAAHKGLPARWGGMGVHYINPKCSRSRKSSHASAARAPTPIS